MASIYQSAVDWPSTVTRIDLQVYVKGEFVGGADVLEEMHTKGELKAAIA